MRKGSIVPALVVVFAFSAIFGSFVTGLVAETGAGFFSEANTATSADWVGENLVPRIKERCQQSGIQQPFPSDSNISHRFYGLQEIEVEQTEELSSAGAGYTGTAPALHTYRRTIKLHYEGGGTETIGISSVESATNPSGLPCHETQWLNTSGSGYSRALTVNSGSEIDFRVYEDQDQEGNITIQVIDD